MPRIARIARETSETAVTVTLNLDGEGRFEGGSTVAFFDHMLTQVVKHGVFDFSLKAKGDTAVDCHHTIEDVGIVFGMALGNALGGKEGIRRYGSATTPMDESLVLCAVDLSGRPYLHFEVPFTVPRLGEMDTEMVVEFFRAVCQHAGVTLHIQLLHGTNNHHMAEAVFKAFGRALREAVAIDARVKGVPSTKGILV